MDRENFRVFYDSNAPGVHRYVQAIVGDAAAASDITQEAFLRMLIANVAEGLTLEHRRNYLFRIATNLVRDHQRRSGRTVSVSNLGSAKGDGPDLATRDLVHKALTTLKIKERELLWLAVVEENNHADIAARTGYRVSSIAPLLYQAKRNLRNIVTKLLKDKRSTS